MDKKFQINNENTSKFEIINGDGTNLEFSDVYDYIYSGKPKIFEGKPKDIIVPVERKFNNIEKIMWNK